MNLDDALLIRKVLIAAHGSDGKTHEQLAKECGVGMRRMTNLLFCLEKAGLVTTHADGAVCFSETLAFLVRTHVLLLAEQRAPRHVSGTWSRLVDEARVRRATDHALFPDVFNSIFGIAPARRKK